MKATTRQALTHALFEASFVVFGVVLALAANEWRQSQRDAEAARSALAGIREEIEANRAAVADVLAYHDGLLAMIGEARRGAGPAPKPGDFPRGFIAPAGLSDTAWSVSAATGTVSHMRYETVLELSAVYDLQAQYEQQAFSAGELIYAALLHDGILAITENYGNLGSLIAAFAYRERQLLETYGEVLAGALADAGAAD